MTRLPIVLAVALVASAAAPALRAQAPTTWRLLQVGRDRVPMTVSTGEDGRPLLRLVEETLTMGPGDRVTRVTVMRADVYERTPCALLAQLRAAERARAAGDTTRPAPPRDTTAAMCADLRASRDTTAGRVVTEGGQRWVQFTAAPGRSMEPRARLVARGDTLDLEVDAVVMRYVRAGR